jgi:streptomycin 6-kinase
VPAGDAAVRRARPCPIVRSAELGHSAAAAVHRLDFLSDALGVDRERARGWAVAQTMAWAFDGLAPIEGHLDVVRWLLSA